MAAVYTNVEQVTHNAVGVNNVKSVNFTENIPPLLSQSDGARGNKIVGDLGTEIDVTVELEDTGADLGSRIGFANKGNLVFKTQLEDNKASVKTWTITDVVFASQAHSTDQANPGGVTLTGRIVDQDTDTVSVA